MGLKADIDEVAKVWRQSPWRVKAFLALSLFLATSSIASLSETVFKWKGFLLDALSFYRNNITGPAFELAQQVLRVTLPAGFADFVVVGALIVAMIVRTILFSVQPRSQAIAFAINLVVINLLGLVVMARDKTPMNPTIAWLTYAAFVLLVLRAARGATRILGVSYLLIPPVLVALLAAVNAGVTRAV